MGRMWWISCSDSIAVGRLLRFGWALVTVGQLLLWVCCCRLVAVGWSLWVVRCGLVAVGWSLCWSIALYIVLWVYRFWLLGLGHYKLVTVSQSL